MNNNHELSDSAHAIRLMDTLLTNSPSAIPTLPQALTDEEVVRRVLAGEQALFELIMRRYNQRLYRAARAYGIPDADCDDMLQQSYMSAYENMGSFRGEAKFGTWLTRILINQCLMYRRKQKSAPINLQDPLDHAFPHLQEGSSPETDLIGDEMRMRLEAAIEALPDEFRTVYVMREIEEMSVKETAACLGLSAANVKVRLYRAKGLLRDSLLRNLRTRHLFEFGFTRCDALVGRVLREVVVGC